MINNLKNIYRHRVLIYTLTIRELKARYRGSVLGFMWSFLNPLLMMLVYTLVFSFYFRNSMRAYAAYLCAGLLPWIWFSSGLLEGSRSIIVGSNLVNKALFPAEILPLVSVLSNMVNFLLSLPMLLIILLAYNVHLTFYALLVFIPIIIQTILMTGIVMFLATFSVFFRDTEQILANVLNLFFFVCPILYQISDIKIVQNHPFLWKFNPIAHVIMSYQDIFFFGKLLHWKRLLVVGLLSIVMFFVGYIVFNRNKDNFPEEV